MNGSNGVLRVALTSLSLFIMAGTAHAGGQQTFATRCSMCHQTTGAGLPGTFPRLAGRAAQIASSPDGRAYLVKVLANGLYGPITVDGKAISGMMPGMGTMSDQDIADVLNYAVALKKVGKPALYTAAEVAKVRADGKMSGSAVAAERARVAAKGGIP